jgi:hypothetical protein
MMEKDSKIMVNAGTPVEDSTLRVNGVHVQEITLNNGDIVERTHEDAFGNVWLTHTVIGSYSIRKLLEKKEG